LIGVVLGAQIGKSSSRALEAPRHEINTCIKRIDKKLIGLGQGAQVGKSSSRPLEASRHEIHIFIKIFDKAVIGFGQGALIWQILLYSSRSSKGMKSILV
jgi:hypothetical protein